MLKREIFVQCADEESIIELHGARITYHLTKRLKQTQSVPPNLNFIFQRLKKIHTNEE